MKISLIICAYNEEKYIGDCLNSVVLHAANELHEIIVINNVSTDNTKNIVLTYQNNGVSIVDESQKGLVRARQRGYITATGDILAYIDADTKITETWLPTIQKEFEDPNLACLSGPHIYYDLPAWQKIVVKIYWILSFPVYKILGYMITGANFSIRKEVLQKMEGFDTKIEFYGEDTDIARRAHKFGKVKFMSSFGILTSGRRFLHQGILSTGYLYAANFFSEIFIKKPVTEEYTDYR